MNPNAPEFLYHVIFIISHLEKSPNREIQKVQIVGTYTSIKHAQVAAHCCLFDAGYEREWFKTFETRPEALEELSASHGVGLAVYAVTTDGTTFRVHISISPNDFGLTTENEDGRVAVDLYHVIQTNVRYDENETKSHETHIEGTFKSYLEARDFASTLLLSEEDGISRESYQDFLEASPNETDCGYGENCIVHATGDGGENYLVSVIKGKELESVKLAEASLMI